MSVCRVAMLSFLFGDPCRPGELYSGTDLQDVSDFCQAYLDEGLTVEPMDGFDLKGFIDWAAPHIKKGENSCCRASKAAYDHGMTTTQEKEHSAAVQLHAQLAKINLETVFPICTDRHISRKDTAAMARKVMKLHGIKGVSITAPNYSMAQAVHVRLPERKDYELNEFGTIKDYPTDPACVANREAEAKIEAILARAFPNHDNRSDYQTDYFDYKFSVG